MLYVTLLINKQTKFVDLHVYIHVTRKKNPNVNFNHLRISTRGREELTQ